MVSAPKATTIPEWLDILRPGWAARFAPAFECLGISTVAQVRSMSAVDLDSLETELKESGARLVQVKQLRKALEALTNSSKEHDAAGQSTPSAIRACIDYRYYESPMAAYFGESECNLVNTLHAESPLGNVTNLDHDGSMRASPSRICSQSGLPFKSPMSAYFDGDDDWESIMSPEGDIMTACSAASLNSNVSARTACTAASPGSSCMAPSPASCYIASSPGSTYMASPMIVQMVPACVVSCHTAALVPQCQSFNLPASQPHGSGCTQIPMKSALNKTPKNKDRHVRWSEAVVEVKEASEKPSLCLVSLLSTPASKSLPLAQQVWQLSQDAQGTFEVQKALEDCSNDDERAALAAQLYGHVFEATQCPHANHVLRKVITSMSPPALNFIVLELMAQGPGGISEIARHRFGCRILEGLLVRCPLEQLCCMVKSLLADATALCTHMYGNFVMQRLLEHAPSDLRAQLLKVVHANLVAMGTNFYGSTVLVKAMSHGNENEKLVLARAILSIKGLITAIARYRHGKVIFELVLDAVEEVEKGAAAKQFEVPPLKAPKIGRGC